MDRLASAADVDWVTDPAVVLPQRLGVRVYYDTGHLVIHQQGQYGPEEEVYIAVPIQDARELALRIQDVAAFAAGRAAGEAMEIHDDDEVPAMFPVADLSMTRDRSKRPLTGAERAKRYRQNKKTVTPTVTEDRNVTPLCRDALKVAAE